MTAAMSVGVGGSWKPVAALSVGVSGSWASVLNAWVGVGGSWQQFFSSMSVVIGSGVLGAGSSGSNVFAPNTAVITGGTGPFSHSWTETDNGIGSWSTGSTNPFQPVVTGIGPGQIATATYTDTVTDTGTGLVVTSNTAIYQWDHT